MTTTLRSFHKALFAATSALLLATIGGHAAASSAEDLNKDAAQALVALYKARPVAEEISKKAKAILVFPKIVKAGLVFGGSYGDRVLMNGDAYAFISDQQGLMASLSIDGTKLSRIRG